MSGTVEQSPSSRIRSTGGRGIDPHATSVRASSIGHRYRDFMTSTLVSKRQRYLRDRRERLAMNRARPVAVECREVLWRAVALVGREAVVRIHGIELDQQRVASGLGEYGRRRDRRNVAVAFDDGVHGA